MRAPHEIRDPQDALSYLGVSFLGRCEYYVLASLDAVRGTLARLAGHHLLAAESPMPAKEKMAVARRSGAENAAIAKSSQP